MFRQLSQLLGKEGEQLGNELSAPYEVPQFPIEQIQSKLNKVQRGEPGRGAGSQTAGASQVKPNNKYKESDSKLACTASFLCRRLRCWRGWWTRTSSV